MGAVPGTYLAGKLLGPEKGRGPQSLFFSVVIGFGISSVASAWSYGLFGASHYFLFMISATILSLSFVVIKKFRSIVKIVMEFSKKDLFLIFIPLYIAAISKSYWSGLFKFQIAGGAGPDIPQNLMAIESQKQLGQTWNFARQALLEKTGTQDLNGAIQNFLRFLSMREVAGYDYLVFGTRWGLTIPFSQIFQIEPSSIIAIPGLVTVCGLSCLALCAYSFASIFEGKHFVKVIMAVVMVSSGGFLTQVFSGGLAQAWALPGVSLLSFCFIYSAILKARAGLTLQKNLVFITLFAIGWISCAVTYLDAAMVIAGLFLFSGIFLFLFVGPKFTLHLLALPFAGGVLAALLVSPYTYASLLTLPIRIKLAAGTGLAFKHWPLPSESLGLLNIWTGPSSPRSSIVLILGVIVSVFLVIFLLFRILSKSKEERVVTFIALSVIFFSLFIFLWTKYGLNGINYSYIKATTYISPLLFLVIYHKYFLETHKKSSHQKRSGNKTNTLLAVTFNLLSAGIIFTAFSVSSGLYNRAQYSVPVEQMKVMHDLDAQREFMEYDYLMPYSITSTLLGVFGDIHWISQVPNDQLLQPRINRELRVLCYLSDDILCNPESERIKGSKLDYYGYKVFKSPITVREFSELTPKERYAKAFSVIGQPPFEIPERFIGGTPYLKPEK